MSGVIQQLGLAGILIILVVPQIVIAGENDQGYGKFRPLGDSGNKGLTGKKERRYSAGGYIHRRPVAPAPVPVPSAKPYRYREHPSGPTGRYAMPRTQGNQQVWPVTPRFRPAEQKSNPPRERTDQPYHSPNGDRFYLGPVIPQRDVNPGYRFRPNDVIK